MCRELFRKNDGKCAWGECRTCGVIPLLFKLGKGEMYEEADAAARLKESILGATDENQ